MIVYTHLYTMQSNIAPQYILRFGKCASAMIRPWFESGLTYGAKLGKKLSVLLGNCKMGLLRFSQGTARFRNYLELKIEPEPNSGCWLWLGEIDRGGYGRCNIQGRTIGAHRVIYELEKGPIPPRLTLDHLCRVRSCVNPNHLEPVPHQVNCQRGLVGEHLRRRTHCPQGHLYSESNTIMRKNSRHCRTCRNVRHQEWWRRRGAGMIDKEAKRLYDAARYQRGITRA